MIYEHSVGAPQFNFISLLIAVLKTCISFAFIIKPKWCKVEKKEREKKSINCRWKIKTKQLKLNY